jgi:hypothetical protein
MTIWPFVPIRPVIPAEDNPPGDDEDRSVQAPSDVGTGNSIDRRWRTDFAVTYTKVE